MALSYNQYIGNGANAAFPTPVHLEDTHIKVYLDGVLQSTSTYIHNNGNSIIFTSAPAIGTVIRIARETNHNGRLTDYNNTAALTAEALDYDATQTFYMAQEAIDISRDGMSEYNALAQDAEDIIANIESTGESIIAAANEAKAEAQRLINISEENFVLSTDFYHAGGSAPLSPGLGDFWYDTTRKELNVYDGSSWGTSVPENQTLTFDDTDFDASETGYNFINVPNVNEHIFVFLNGVKQVKASTKANLLAATGAKDYFVDVSNNRVYFKPLNSGDSIEVILSTNEVGTRNKTKIDNYTATQGQTVFNTTQDYIPDSNSMHVFVNGVRQTAFTETDENTVTLTNGLNAGDEVTLIVNGYEPVQGTMPATSITYVPTGETTSTITAQKMFDAVSQPNLLINGDFGISQRGTSKTGGGYLVDRWNLRSEVYTGGTSIQSQFNGWTNGNQGMSAYSGSGFYLHHYAQSHTSECYIVQNTELTKDLTLWSQKDFTAAVEFNFDNEVEMRVQLRLIDSSDSVNDFSIATSNWEAVGAGNQTKIFNLTTSNLSSLGWTPDPSEDRIQLYINYRDKNSHAGVPDGSYRFHNVKLEEGDIFTGWPHVDRATELAKCQRYFYKHDGSALFACDYANGTHRMLTVPLPVTMRATPAVTATLTGSGWSSTTPVSIYPGKSYCQLNGIATSSTVFSTDLGDFSADAEL